MSELTFTANLEKSFEKCPFVQRIHIENDGILYRQGDPCCQVFWIIRGIVRLDHIDPRGNTLTLALLRRGDLLGNLEVSATPGKTDETARAINEVYLFRLEQTRFREWLSQNPEVAWQVFERLSANRRQAERRLRSFLTESVENRLIETLKDLAKLFGIRCTHGYALEIHLTQQELADLVGANRSVVSTIMNNLRNRGLLDYTRNLICIHDKAIAELSEKAN